MTPLTDGQLDELARLEAGATAGEWYAFFRKGGLEGTGVEVCASDDSGTFFLATFDCGNLDQSDRDRNFIIAARNALPALLAELRLLLALGDAVDRRDAEMFDIPFVVSDTLKAWQQWKDGTK